MKLQKKQIKLTAILMFVCAGAFAQDSLFQDTDNGVIVLDSLVDISVLDKGWKLSTIDPCDHEFWPLIFTEMCPTNKFHCRICGKDFKINESMVYVLMEIQGDTKYFDFAHLRCSLKRIR